MISFVRFVRFQRSMEARFDALESVVVLLMRQIDMQCSDAGQTDAEALETVKRIVSLSSAFASEYALVRKSDGQLALSRDPRLRSVAAVPSRKRKKKEPVKEAKWIPRFTSLLGPPPLEDRPAKISKNRYSTNNLPRSVHGN